MRGARETFCDQIFCDGGEIIIDALPMGLEPGFVPRRTEFAAAANVGEHEDAAALEPQLAQLSGIRRRARIQKSAVRIENRRSTAIHLHRLGMHDEVGNLRAVFRSGCELFDHIARCIELRGQRFDGCQRLLAQVGKQQLRRCKKAGDLQEGALAVQIRIDQVDGDIVRQLELTLRPMVAGFERVYA